VHHTAGTNTYTAEQSAGVVHSIWQYHAVERGFGDIGYNFLVDKYGQMFEGRRHSLPESGSFSVAAEVPTGWSIEAGHATGYNKGGLGISAMGDYTKSVRSADPGLVVEPIAQLIAWKFNLANLDVVLDGARVPSGFISPGTSSTYPVGADLPRIFVHKDVAATLCPGSIAGSAVIDQLYARVVDLYDDETYLPQAADTTPPEVTLAAADGTVALTASDNSGASSAIFHTTDGSKVFYSPDWHVTACGVALVGVTNPRSCVVDTRYTVPFSLLAPSTVSYLAVDGAANTSAQQSAYIPLGGTVEPNTAPTVTITSPVNGAEFEAGATIEFAGSASDPEDGDLTARIAWTSDLDGPIGTGGTFTKLLTDGTHTITATVTDNLGASASTTATVSVGEPAPAPIEDIALEVHAYKIKATKYADLTWSGGAPDFTIYRNGTAVATKVSGS